MPRRLLFAALGAATLSAAAQTMEPGEWQFTSTMSSPMLPAPQTSTFTQCVKQEDADDPTRFNPRDQTADCKVTPGRRTPDSYAWTVSCPQQGMRGEGVARFGRGQVESEMHVVASAQGQSIEMRTKVTGRRLGPCKS